MQLGGNVAKCNDIPTKTYLEAGPLDPCGAARDSKELGINDRGGGRVEVAFLVNSTMNLCSSLAVSAMMPLIIFIVPFLFLLQPICDVWKLLAVAARFALATMTFPRGGAGGTPGMSKPSSTFGRVAELA